MSSTRKAKGLFPLQLDFLGKRYGYLPCDLMKLDPVDLAFCLDIASIGHAAELEEIRKVTASAKTKGEGRHDPSVELDRMDEMIQKLPKNSLARKKWEESKRRVSGGRDQ